MAPWLGWIGLNSGLSVVLTLSINEASALRGAILAFVYALGIGIPFVLAGLLFSRLAGAIGWLKRHQRPIQVAGGVVLMLVGLALVTGLWDRAMAVVRQWAVAYGAPI